MNIRKIILIIEIAIIILGMVYILHGCFGIIYTQMTHLDDDELGWIMTSRDLSDNTYTNSIFLSNEGDTSILRYTDFHIKNTRNPFFFKVFTNGNYSYQAMASYEYEIYSDADTIQGYFRLFKPFEIREAAILSYLNYFSSSNPIFSEPDELPNVTDAQPIHIKDINYPHCLVFDSINSSYGDWSKEHVTNKIEKYVISKEEGLIYYKYSDGREYFKILNDTIQSIKRD